MIVICYLLSSCKGYFKEIIAGIKFKKELEEDEKLLHSLKSNDTCLFIKISYHVG